ncbi:translesion error-prone DNA polymerase V autoproteolytic subunit [Actimicrobium sp. CCC2.4]|uniref:LexA family protein n=1 Tax=Actimicrobium sp. CCC2.4 TaxID=3048606 RepID=UPI002AC9C0CD|nr:translesion error-prone DNA polymerase V autoproteolytic subunit [Actimicrobium sp. CCC2.4]MEB0134572.1 translesion error-prone DNA polymerase V autoproteolytic subunit [Actimicrobium sp. CCC2.4]WPX34014.1 translesion error-prone DNA polymerase V autoproteolytic subunit [Actimicrobium sp. CCC2.4]
MSFLPLLPLPDAAHATAVPACLVPASALTPVCPRPLYGQRISAGFPSPAEEYLEKGLDLNQYLVRNKTATFYFRVQGDSMVGARIFDGDMVVVDRSLTSKHRSIVLAVVNADYTIKRLHKRAGVIELRAENPRYAPIQFGDGETLEIWGVVVGVVCRFDA